ncbi:uncharacterized protein LOC124284349 [Haliotis rubra]|uniref:uncharacterized protein LOC124284349 n=1 Tax=Haliotis rubra TaxID=36100 RepID=UPI001EE61008|nr:uncharacterized protein LOC124284349 [Haliotis rubra]
MDTIKALQAQVELMESDSIKSLSKMERKLKSAETQLMQKEVDIVNEEAVLQTKFEKQLKQVKASADLTVKDLKIRLLSQDREMTTMKQQLHHKEHQLQQVREELEDTQRSLEKKNNVLLEELSHYVTQNRNRTVSLSKLSKEGCKSDDTVAREKWTLISNICDMVLEDLQGVVQGMGQVVTNMNCGTQRGGDLEATHADMVVVDHSMPSTVPSSCSQHLGKHSQDNDQLLQSLQKRVHDSGELIKRLTQPQPITVTIAFANYVRDSLVSMCKDKFRKARSGINTILTELMDEESDEEEPLEES